MTRHKGAFCMACIAALLILAHAARELDNREQKHPSKGSERKAVQAAGSESKVKAGKKSPNVVMLDWKPVPETQDVFALSFEEVPSTPPPNFAGQLAALESQNSVVQLSGRGYKNDVAIPLNGTVTITARDAWSPVLADMKRLQPSITATDAPTAYAYR